MTVGLEWGGDDFVFDSLCKYNGNFGLQMHVACRIWFQIILSVCDAATAMIWYQSFHLLVLFRFPAVCIFYGASGAALILLACIVYALCRAGSARVGSTVYYYVPVHQILYYLFPAHSPLFSFSFFFSFLFFLKRLFPSNKQINHFYRGIKILLVSS